MFIRYHCACFRMQTVYQRKEKSIWVIMWALAGIRKAGFLML